MKQIVQYLEWLLESLLVWYMAMATIVCTHFKEKENLLFCVCLCCFYSVIKCFHFFDIFNVLFCPPRNLDELDEFTVSVTAGHFIIFNIHVKTPDQVIDRNKQMSSFNKSFMFHHKPNLVLIFRHKVFKNFYAHGAHSSLANYTFFVFIREEG